MAAAEPVILLDIEGTICPISFVKETLFPYALRSLPRYLSTHWTDPLPPPLSAFPASATANPTLFTAHFAHLTATDSKLPHFKTLQGQLFAHGYSAGELVTPLFADVAPSLRRWVEELGVRVAIYSSGSVAAQQMLMAHTDAGDLTGWL
ncbi:MAG: 2,3-diketo-5-methylthio-1-phosphopentane phosphatase [Lasallia pustulata]|uniref:2,3-diketo-5-methylthio-1-phosphopentane phosphatase n=1 Tax=Lasallia pustulata TaxID=136370 RepID=A0A5M8PS71_9LECA|nr:MAG: 2,3-diketo-5-methylthio-1-phosphopentane phosphatase [Lasallia pustulata]